MSTDYGKRLRTARKAAQLTQARLAQLVGVGQSAIAGLERIGHGSAYTHQIATECGVNPHWLATGDGSMEPSASRRANSDLSPLAQNLGWMLDRVEDPIDKNVANVRATQAILDVMAGALPTHKPGPTAPAESTEGKPRHVPHAPKKPEKS